VKPLSLLELSCQLKLTQSAPGKLLVIKFDGWDGAESSSGGRTLGSSFAPSAQAGNTKINTKTGGIILSFKSDDHPKI
jgi:hypothetical protein